MNKTISKFRNEYWFLSNFSESKIEFDGYIYSNVEAAFHAQKNDSATYKHIMQFQPSKLAEKEGRKVKLRSDWEQVKNDIMYQIVKAKFTQNSDLKKLLLATDEAILEEGNYWHDNYWGVCKCEGSRCLNTVSKNYLGRIIMRVREELRQ